MLLLLLLLLVLMVYSLLPKSTISQYLPSYCCARLFFLTQVVELSALGFGPLTLRCDFNTRTTRVSGSLSCHSLQMEKRPRTEFFSNCKLHTNTSKTMGELGCDEQRKFPLDCVHKKIFRCLRRQDSSK